MSYLAGQRVRVASRPHDGHHRTPGYLKGRIGCIERVHGAFRNPETRAYGEDGLPKVPLYLVSFLEEDLAADDRRLPRVRVYADLFEHWLESAE